MAYIPNSNSVVAFQSDPTKLVGTVSVVGTLAVGGGSIIALPTGNQSVSGTVGASVIGHAPVVIVGGSVAASFTPPANQSVSGAVQIAGESPNSIVTVKRVDGAVNASALGLVAAAVIHGETTAGGGGTYIAVKVNPSGTLQTEAEVVGSVTALQGGTWRTSIINSTPSSLLVGASLIGLSPVNVTNQVTIVSSIAGGIFPISGSVAAFVTGGIQSVAFAGANTVSVVGSVTAYQGAVPWVTVPTSGSIIATQGGTWSTSVMTNVITSIATAGAVMGSVATLQGTNPWIVNFQNSSILAVPVGSVITLNQGSSILAVPVGSTIAVLQAASIVGTYAEDSAHTSADKGIFGLNVRNDTMSSITSADSDYSPMAVGPAGEVVIANAPITKWVYGTTSIVSGPSVAVIAAQGASVFTYVTGLNIVNPSANNLTGNLSTGAGAASVLVYWTAPANGGSNMIFPNPLRSRDNTAILASISGVGSVFLSAQGFISKT